MTHVARKLLNATHAHIGDPSTRRWLYGNTMPNGSDIWRDSRPGGGEGGDWQVPPDTSGASYLCNLYTDRGRSYSKLLLTEVILDTSGASYSRSYCALSYRNSTEVTRSYFLHASYSRSYCAISYRNSTEVTRSYCSML